MPDKSRKIYVDDEQDSSVASNVIVHMVTAARGRERSSTLPIKED
ncbi:hypothetical protein [Brevibacillus sp. SIMBA_076]